MSFCRLRWRTNWAKRIGFLAIGIGLMPWLWSCTQASPEVPTAPPPTQAEETEPAVQDYRIGPEDVVEVMVWKNEDLSRVVNVRPDGKISLPLIGDMTAAGLTAEALKDEIVVELKQFYKEPPQVSVIVQQVNSYAIYILGQVRTPGRYVVKTGTTFLQALTLAGGFTDYASTNRIVLRRQNADKSEETAMRFRFKDVVRGKQRNILMQTGDTIIIP